MTEPSTRGSLLRSVGATEVVHSAFAYSAVSDAGDASAARIPVTIVAR
jgi:hypothetical protein